MTRPPPNATDAEITETPRPGAKAPQYGPLRRRLLATLESEQAIAIPLHGRTARALQALLGSFASQSGLSVHTRRGAAGSDTIIAWVTEKKPAWPKEATP